MTQNDDAHNREPRPRGLTRLRRRILVPLAAAVLVLIAATSLLLYRDAQARTTSESAEVFDRVLPVFETALAEDASILGGVLDVLADDASLRSAFQAGDTEAVLAEAGPLFQRLREDHRITHFYFLDPSRVCILRVHHPKRHGDKIDRFTAIQAEKTGKLSWGIELGPLGTFTLRVVQPWYDGDRLIGYLELGEEIEHITERMKESLGLEFVVVIDKQFLSREKWLEGRKMLGREAN